MVPLRLHVPYANLFSADFFSADWVSDDGLSPVVVVPYAVSAGAAGLAVSYPADRRDTSEAFRLSDAFSGDVSFGSDGPLAGPAAVAAHDALSVTLRFALAAPGTPAPAPATAPFLDAVLVKGAPFVTVMYSHAWPVLTTASQFARVTGLSLAQEASGESDPAPDPKCSANAG